MSNVNPSELVKWGAYGGYGWFVSTRAGAAKWDPKASRDAQPLTQDDLERVATLSMLAPGTGIKGLGQVVRWGEVRIQYFTCTIVRKTPMSNVRPDELVKWQSLYFSGRWFVSTRAEAVKLNFEASRNPQPLTQDDLERVATLSMLAPGTKIEGLGEVWADCEVFYLYPRAGDSNE